MESSEYGKLTEQRYQALSLVERPNVDLQTLTTAHPQDLLVEKADQHEELQKHDPTYLKSNHPHLQ
tara:strand:- start:4 stop:201 length:198 start_codon:yes stop_codon:yes gene_type:complete